jgi:low affinity Fe/Cu permease
MTTAQPANGQRHNHNGSRAAGWFDQLAKGAARLSGKPATFLLSVLLIIVWLVSGPFFGFSDTWQLVINTGTTIVTFLMVFLIQNTQNRDTAAVHLKLDELIRAIAEARNSAIDLEDQSEEELLEARNEYVGLAEKAHEELGERGVKLQDPECEVESAAKR